MLEGEGKSAYLADESCPDELSVTIWSCQQACTVILDRFIAIPSSLEAERPPDGIHKLDRVDRCRVP